jgi:hypothetical protein
MAGGFDNSTAQLTYQSLDSPMAQQITGQLASQWPTSAVAPRLDGRRLGGSTARRLTAQHQTDGGRRLDGMAAQLLSSATAGRPDR